MRFTGTFKSIKINTSAYTKVLDDFLEEQVKRAATAWLNATVVAVIPVWSGASAATFRKLAQAVSFPLTITGVAPQGAYGALGPQYGMQRSEGSTETQGGVSTFTYGTSLFHLVYNESQDGNVNKKAAGVFASLNNPGPYGFQALGASAFEEFAQNVRLPSPWINATTTTIKIG